MSTAELPGPAEPVGASFRAKEQAAEWFALLRSGDATDADRDLWAAWLAASDNHRNAWSYVESVSRRFAPIRTSPDPRTTVGVLHADTALPLRRRQVLLGLATFGGTGLLSWGLWRHTTLPTTLMAWTVDHHIGVGEHRTIRLADGSRIWLGSASALNVDFRADLRRLNLVSGDLFIETAPDTTRPFVVDTRHGRLRALGTRFNVRQDGVRTTVSVYEGAVEVRTANGRATVVVQAGQQTRFDQGAIEPMTMADPMHEGWTQGMLTAQDMSLGQVVAELARYRHGHLDVAPEVAGLGVYGSFPLDDTDRTLTMLASVLPIQVRQPLPWWTTIKAEHSPAGETSDR